MKDKEKTILLNNFIKAQSLIIKSQKKIIEEYESAVCYYADTEHWFISREHGSQLAMDRISYKDHSEMGSKKVNTGGLRAREAVYAVEKIEEEICGKKETTSN